MDYKGISKKLLSLILLVVLFISCTENQLQQSNSSAKQGTFKEPLSASTTYKKGDIVPHDYVCMVNDAYMGKKQIEVNYNGKLYYGCCEMCQKRIPQDESVRVAIDPVSSKQVDKAKSVIAITGNKGEVSYFENKANYNTFYENYNKNEK
jgi:YHS domain-containing protein